MAGTRERTAATLTDPHLIGLVDAHVRAVPERVRAALRPPATATGVAIIDRLPLRDAELGPTPRDWRQAAAWSGDAHRGRASFRLDLTMLLLARCAGAPFGWQGQQSGRLVNNIVPSPGHEHEQSGASSVTLLAPHTEDAFHPERAHLLLLGCLRNPALVGTTVSSVCEARLSPEHRRRLAAAALPILPDVSYGDGFGDHPTPPIATLAAGPTLRYDPAYTPVQRADAEFRDAYTQLSTELERVARVAVLEPGQLLLVDNDVVVHGRVPFAPRYDGTDRWLKRVNIRLPQRHRAESGESGYGQRTVAPFRTEVPAPHAVPIQ
ncbi:TauD/TfdA family dioxygenase [Nocardia sp. alder85J]|uniref:TauD/TfdA family dioxygenase n=1 Tax=Nocardia sp. alder85J TaxID=2862949 RepID=UPI00224E680B|nr:TauD/TfdA family dioxygenase [Nocardia sp. alder85J]MCX4096183.1 TauD/TfdA family dioxygenase [Nocardia sp. alder85J]